MARKPLSFQQALMAAFTPAENSPLGHRASNEAMLRYLPQIQALLALRGQAALTGRQNVQQIRRGGLTAAGGIRQVRNSFQQQLADTPAPTSEAAAHLGLTRDAVSGALANMQAAQYSGIAGGVSQARRATQASQAQIVQQLMQAAQQGSLYNTSEYDSLAADRAKSRQAAAQAKATLYAGLAKAGFGADGKPIPGIFNKLHPGNSNKAPVDGVDFNTWLHMTPEQRQAQHKAWSAAGGGGNGGMTPAQRRAQHNQFGTIRDTIDTIHHDIRVAAATPIPVDPNDPKKGTRAPTDAEISTAIASKHKNASPLIIRAATEWAHGGIRQPTIKALKQRYGSSFQIPHPWHYRPPTLSRPGVAPSGHTGSRPT